MADLTNSAPPQHLTYTVTNERGWNDPPTSVFTSNSSNNRKRIDPRKARVHHNINASFYNQPVRNNVQSNISETQQHFNKRSLVPGSSPLHHANSNPDLSQMTLAHSSLPPVLHHAASVPNNLYDAGQTSHTNLASLNSMTMAPKGLSNTPPPPLLNRNVSGTSTPPANVGTGRKLSASNTSGGINDVLRNYATPTMLQTSHLNKSFETAQSIVPLTNGKCDLYTTNNTHNMLSNHTTSHLNSPVPPYTNCHSPVPIGSPLVSSTSHNSASGLITRVSPNSNAVAPPPTSGFYAANKNSPKHGSPSRSEHNSPVPSESIENDSELLSQTVRMLKECKEKCLCHLTNKVSEDVSKRINMFEICWSSGKLSTPVKLKMSQLTQALLKGDFIQAENQHKSLITVHSSEVKSWMVGIKKLISSYQRAIEENNKFK